MKLKIHNATINASIMQILLKLQSETGNPIDIQDKGANILITCPFHKNGRESKPSCSIVCDEYNDVDELGTFHCWACGEKGHIPKIVAKIHESSYAEANKWILDNFPNSVTSELLINDRIDLTPAEKKVLTLDKYEPLTERAYNYLITNRHLTKEVVDYFHVLYNRETDAVVFPVFDTKNNLSMITERCITEKRFNISTGITKPIYLLYEAQKYKTVYVCESQINTLTLWSWGYPAIGLIGTGSQDQYDILNRSGIRQFILCLDGDDAGRTGTKRFIKNVKGALVLVVDIPNKKDINDLTLEEFKSLNILHL